MSETFEEVVADWLRQEGADVREVQSVVAYGTDWAGDTEGGFYSESDVTITYVDGAGATGRREVSGESMGDLWQFVMKAWPGRGAR